MIVQDKIKLLMSEKKMTQADLSRLTGVSTGVISNLLSGYIKNPKFLLMEKIATALDVPLDAFREEKT